jgi:hypothetical protein
VPNPLLHKFPCSHHSNYLFNEYCKVDSRRYPLCFRSGYAFLEATVIVGHRERDNLSGTPDDKVFTCQFGIHGNLSSVVKELEGQELTVIIYMKE